MVHRVVVEEEDEADVAVVQVEEEEVVEVGGVGAAACKAEGGRRAGREGSVDSGAKAERPVKAVEGPGAGRGRARGGGGAALLKARVEAEATEEGEEAREESNTTRVGDLHSAPDR